MSGIRSKVADAVLRAKPYVVANKLSMASLALGLFDAAKHNAVDIDKFMAFEDPDFRHDVHIFGNWDLEKHQCRDEHCLPRSSVWGS